MVESSKKSPATKRVKFNPMVVNQLAENHGVTAYFVRESIKGNRNSERSETIRKEYPQLCSQIDALLKK